MLGDVLNWSMAAISLAVFISLSIVNELGYRIGGLYGRDEPEESRAVAHPLGGRMMSLNPASALKFS